MKALVVYAISWLLFLTAHAQLRTFRSVDSRLKVYAGDTVSILADSAFIVSGAQALQFNEKLLALQASQIVYQDLHSDREELLSKVVEIEDQVARLMDRLQSNQYLMEYQLAQLLSELDQSIATLQQSNLDLTRTNEQLEEQLLQLDGTVKLLRQQNRKLAWRHTRDKVLIGLAGLGVGLLVGGW